MFLNRAQHMVCSLPLSLSPSLSPSFNLFIHHTSIHSSPCPSFAPYIFACPNIMTSNGQTTSPIPSAQSAPGSSACNTDPCIHSVVIPPSYVRLTFSLHRHLQMRTVPTAGNGEGGQGKEKDKKR